DCASLFSILVFQRESFAAIIGESGERAFIVNPGAGCGPVSSPDATGSVKCVYFQPGIGASSRRSSQPDHINLNALTRKLNAAVFEATKRRSPDFALGRRTGQIHRTLFHMEILAVGSREASREIKAISHSN
ncbi:MAG: hypothetical protein ACREAB_18925, partial [Blastocatellia bacterium]